MSRAREVVPASAEIPGDADRYDDFMNALSIGPARSVSESTLQMAGETFCLCTTGALWWEGSRTLIVSDLHLEKGSAFAERGIMLPPYDTAATLARLTLAIDRFRPRRIVALGDSFHDGRALARIAAPDHDTLLALQAGRDWLWITGNHDEALVRQFRGDHAERLDESGFRFVHEPTAKGSAEIAGHLHPCAKVRLRGRSVRRRAFVTDTNRILMPAFGAYAGGLDVWKPAIAELFPRGFTAHMLGESKVYSIPGAACT